ncbi:MAG TPA: hypothetical protein VNN79_17930 [Actinomycetota bacterium]|nr:hypothetical protein [Actinomycetota bacterium]
MPTRRRRTSFLLVFGLLTCLLAAMPVTAHARASRSGPGVWTKLATANDASDTIGMLRTGDGKLHLVWLNKEASATSHTFGTATLSLAGAKLSSGTAFSHWDSLEGDPQLVRDGSDFRLVFEGATGSSGCFSTGLVYTATSTNGLTFTLANNTSMSAASAGIGNLAATVESDGTTPVATFAAGRLFHEGTDSCPAGSDGTINNHSGSNVPNNPSIVTDASDGSVWVAWFQTGNTTVGYHVDQILPTELPPVTAPDSTSTFAANNQPHQPVALVARALGGVYMAYCVASSTKPCVHIALWKVGAPASSVMTVPGSATGTAGHVALAAGKAGRISVLWYDVGKNLIHAVRTNTTATAFGVDRTIKPPAHTEAIQDLQGEGTFGRLDVLVNATLTTSGLPSTIQQTQILAGLTLTASPKTFANTAAHTVTFTVKDAGQPESGVKVSCAGLSATDTTNSTGHATLTFPKGFATGQHVCTASGTDYNPGKVTIKVTH